jgi:CheY-like chemotaxis protein
MTIKVFIADDHTIVCDGLRALLETQPDMEVVGTAGDGREAVQLIGRLEPHVAIMDIAMTELNGIEATRLISERHPATRVLILSVYSSAEHIHRALQAGAKGYLLKTSAGSRRTGGALGDPLFEPEDRGYRHRRLRRRSAARQPARRPELARTSGAAAPRGRQVGRGNRTNAVLVTALRRNLPSADDAKARD